MVFFYPPYNISFIHLIAVGDFMKINNRYSFLFLASLYVTTVFAEGGEDFLDAQTTTDRKSVV